MQRKVFEPNINLTNEKKNPSNLDEILAPLYLINDQISSSLDKKNSRISDRLKIPTDEYSNMRKNLPLPKS